MAVQILSDQMLHGSRWTGFVAILLAMCIAGIILRLMSQRIHVTWYVSREHLRIPAAVVALAGVLVVPIFLAGLWGVFYAVLFGYLLTMEPRLLARSVVNGRIVVCGFGPAFAEAWAVRRSLETD